MTNNEVLQGGFTEEEYVSICTVLDKIDAKYNSKLRQDFACKALLYDIKNVNVNQGGDCNN